MTTTFLRSAYILTLLFAIVVAVTGNRLYPKPLMSGEQVAHSIIQAGLLLERGPLYKTCSAKRDIDNCDYCDRRCKDYGGDNFWGKCSLFWPIRECYCYWECP